MCIRDRSKYNFKASISGVSFSVNGNKLTVSMDTAPSKEFTITATKKNAVRRGVVVWSEEMCIRDSTYTDPLGRRKYVYAQDLVTLREKEAQLMKDQMDGLDIYCLLYTSQGDNFPLRHKAYLVVAIKDF